MSRRNSRRWASGPLCARDTPRQLRPSIRCAADVVALLPHLAEAEQEHYYVLGLDSRHRVLVTHCAAIGTVDRVQVTLRDVFREVVRHNCAAIVCTHNHPSGDPAPSGTDHELTHQLLQAARLLGIPLLDHVVIGRGGVYSYAEAGRLTTSGE